MSNKAIALLGAEVKVGMDEVVAVFVAQYEDNLFTRRDELHQLIKEVKAELAGIDTDLLAAVDDDDYEFVNAVLQIESVVESKTVVWDVEGRHEITKPSIVVGVKVSSQVKSNGYRNDSFIRDIPIPLTKSDIKRHQQATDRLTNLRDELNGVMAQIKQVSRKERQVRGRIAAMKLQESGFKDLLDSPELQQLVQL
jgi:hypothetical protein